MKIINIVAILTISMFLIGCSTETMETTSVESEDNEDTETTSVETESSDLMEEMEKISDAVESGKPTKCVITYSNPEMEDSMNIVYYIKGEDLRMETSMQGMSSIAIIKDEIAYTQVNEMMGDTDCDWMSIDPEETEGTEGDYEEADFDYTQYEDDSTYNVKCTPDSFGNEKFDVTGKVCSMEDMMNDLMVGMNMG